MSDEHDLRSQRIENLIVQLSHYIQATEIHPDAQAYVRCILASTMIGANITHRSQREVVIAELYLFLNFISKLAAKRDVEIRYQLHDPRNGSDYSQPQQTINETMDTFHSLARNPGSLEE